MQEFKLKSFDGTEIYVTLWDDVNHPKAVIQLVHGMSEYAGHYDSFAKYLNSRGYIVFGDDHRAHGRTETDANRGNHKGNIFNDTLKDEVYFRTYLQEKYHLPVFLVGHSYGSFLGQAFAQAGTDVKAIALLGTGHMGALFKFASILVAPIWLVAKNWRPKLVNWVSDNFMHFKGDNGKCQWVNSIKEKRDAFVAGKYTHSDMSVNFDYHMMRETSKLYSKKSLSKLNPTTAIDLFCGTDDVVGQKSKGAIKLNKMYKENGIKSEIHLYKGSRHEVIFDIEGQKAQSDIADFFDKFIVYEQQSIDDLM